MKLIPILNRKNTFAIVDDEDYNRILQFKWYANKNGSIKRSIHNMGTIDISMASEVMGQPRFLFDHKDCNPLNNQKFNLRRATISQNNMNTLKRKGCSSQYKGVCWAKVKGKWLSSIALKEVSYHLGYFDDEIKAAEAYNKKAVELFGEFARINVINYDNIKESDPSSQPATF